MENLTIKIATEKKTNTVNVPMTKEMEAVMIHHEMCKSMLSNTGGYSSESMKRRCSETMNRVANYIMDNNPKD